MFRMNRNLTKLNSSKGGDSMKCPIDKKSCKYNKNGSCIMKDPDKNCGECAEPYNGEMVINID